MQPRLKLRAIHSKPPGRAWYRYATAVAVPTTLLGLDARLVRLKKVRGPVQAKARPLGRFSLADQIATKLAFHAGQLAAAPYNGRMAKILLVDDEQDASRAVAFYLEKSGHQVTCAANGRDALREVLNDLPDVVLLDLVMPLMDGGSFLEVVRTHLRFDCLPVVVVTGMEDDPKLERMRQLGISGTLIKGKAKVQEIKTVLESAAATAKVR